MDEEDCWGEDSGNKFKTSGMIVDTLLSRTLKVA